MIKKLLSILLTLCLVAGGLTLCVLAAEGDNSLILIFEESFEEYQADVNVSSTLVPNFFVADANSIGDGYIKVQEAENGNLYLKSHVFSQVYSATPIVGAYEFSLDIHDAQGKAQTGVFIRAPKTAPAYYEGDGYPDASVCQAGLFLYTAGDYLGVNVKTYDENAGATAFLQNNTVEFALPEGVSYPYNLRVTDSGSEIAIYVNDTLICRVTFSDPGQTYTRHQSSGKFFGTAKLFDAAGAEKGSYTNPLLSSDASYIGWTTRSADMIVDNVSVKAEAAYQAVLTISKLPVKVTAKNLENAKEIAAEARALYNALPEDKKALVTNYDKLTKAEESIVTVENATEAPTEAPTEPVETPTEAATALVETPTEAPVEAPSEAFTELVEAPTEASTESNAALDETSAEDASATEVKDVDDSLAIWILIAVMIVAVCGAAGFITVKVRK